MKRQFTIITSLIFLLVLIFPNTSFGNSQLNITLNGKKVYSDVEPFIQNGRTMVPVRFISEQLGYEVTYGYDWVFEAENQLHVYVKDSKGVTITFNDIFIFGSDGMYYRENPNDNLYYKMITLKNDRTFVPIRHLANALNLKVDWDQASQTVILNSNTDPVEIPIYVSKNIEKNYKYIKSPFIATYGDQGYYVKGTDLSIGDFAAMVYHLENLDNIPGLSEKYSRQSEETKEKLNFYRRNHEFRVNTTIIEMFPEKDMVVGFFTM